MEQEEKYCVYYRRNNYLPVLLIMDVLASVFPIAMIRSGYADSTVGYVLLAVLLAAGILDCSPFDPKGFIQWEAVEDIQLWKSTRNGSALELVMKEKNALGKNKNIYVNITYANERSAVILQKAEQYLRESK